MRLVKNWPCKENCGRTAAVRGYCPRCYERAKRHGKIQNVRDKTMVYIEPERVLEALRKSLKPMGLNKLCATLFNYDNGYHPGLERTLKDMLEAGKIIKVKWYSGYGYILNLDYGEKEPAMQYTISAKVPQKGGGTGRNSIETDLKPRAIHLANVFRNNGWQDVKIEVGGKEYQHPWGEVP